MYNVFTKKFESSEKKIVLGKIIISHGYSELWSKNDLRKILEQKVYIICTCIINNS